MKLREIKAKKKAESVKEKRMKLYPIENAIVFTPRKKRVYKTETRHRIRCEYPLVDMLIGDSFFVPGADHGINKKLYKHLNSAIQNYMMRHPGNTFAIRKWESKGIRGVRVWRINRPKP